MAEQAEGAPLLREYGVKSSIEGSNPSLTAIVCFIYSAPVAQLDRVLGYEPSGQRFESFRVRHLLSSNFSFYQKQLTLYLVIFLDRQWSVINNFLVRL